MNEQLPLMGHAVVYSGPVVRQNHWEKRAILRIIDLEVFFFSTKYFKLLALFPIN